MDFEWEMVSKDTVRRPNTCTQVVRSYEPRYIFPEFRSYIYTPIRVHASSKDLVKLARFGEELKMNCESTDSSSFDLMPVLLPVLGYALVAYRKLPIYQRTSLVRNQGSRLYYLAKTRS